MSPRRRNAAARSTELVSRIDANLQKAHVDGQFIAGSDNVQFQIDVRGGHLTLAPPRPNPVLVQPPLRLLPADGIELVGRDDALARLRRLLDVGHVEVIGEDGIGKTALMSRTLNQAAESTLDRLVYVDCREYDSPGDVLAALFFAFYDCDYAIAPSPHATPTYLQDASGLVALDHVTLERDELQSVINALPACVCVAVGTQRRLSGRASNLWVTGLSPVDGASLVMRELARAFTQEDERQFQELARAWDGHPLHLQRCADLLREEDASVGELIQTGWTVDQVIGLDGRMAATLSAEQRHLLVLLAAVMPCAIPEEHLASLEEVPDAAALLRRLRRKGLVEAHSPRYSLRRPLSGTITGDLGATDTIAAEVAGRYAAWAQEADFVERRTALGALVRLQHGAYIVEDWRAVVGLARGLDPILALTGRWYAWYWALLQAESAAQKADDLASAAWASHQQGVRACCNHELDEAQEYFRAAADLRRSIGDESGALASEGNLHVVRQVSPPPVLTEDEVELDGPNWVIAEEETPRSWQLVEEEETSRSKAHEDEEEDEGESTMEATT